LIQKEEPRALLAPSYMGIWSFVHVHPEASFEFKKMRRAKTYTDHLHQGKLAYFVHVTESNACAP